MRRYVFAFFVVLFFVNLFSLMLIPTMESWQIILYVLPVLSILCIVLLSYWSWQDQKEIEWLREQTSKLMRERELEKYKG